MTRSTLTKLRWDVVLQKSTCKPINKTLVNRGCYIYALETCFLLFFDTEKKHSVPRSSQLANFTFFVGPAADFYEKKIRVLFYSTRPILVYFSSIFPDPNRPYISQSQTNIIRNLCLTIILEFRLLLSVVVCCCLYSL